MYCQLSNIQAPSLIFFCQLCPHRTAPVYNTATIKVSILIPLEYPSFFAFTHASHKQQGSRSSVDTSVTPTSIHWFTPSTSYTFVKPAASKTSAASFDRRPDRQYTAMAQSLQSSRREVSLFSCNDGMKVALGKCPASHSSKRRTSSRTSNWPDDQSEADTDASSIVV